jgi:hypothetical protein
LTAGLALTRDVLPKQGTKRVILRCPAWEELTDGAPHGVVVRRLKSAWRRLTKSLSALAISDVVFDAPLDPRYLTTPGLFGLPESPLGPGERAYRIIEGPRVDGNRLRLRLGRARRPRASLETSDDFSTTIYATAQRTKEVFLGLVVGYASTDIGKEAVPRSSSRGHRNPTTAVASALAIALRDLPPGPVNVLTSDALVISVLRGRRRAVRPPAMRLALDKLEEAIARRPDVEVAAHHALKSGNMALRVVSIHAALGAESLDPVNLHLQTIRRVLDPAKVAKRVAPSTSSSPGAP